MKKFIKWASITLASIIGLLALALLALPFLLPLDQIKDFAAAKLSEVIHREVKIEKVSFNFFSGIKLEKISVANQKGFSSQPFISADSLDLKYAFWPVFRRQLIVQEIVLVKPRITLGGKGPLRPVKGEKAEGRRGEKKAKEGGKGEDTFSIIINSISIKDGRIDYIDSASKSKSSIKDLNASVSGILLSLVKPIDFKLSAVAEYQGKNIPLSLNGNIGINLAEEKIVIPNLRLGIAGEEASLSATIAHFRTSPILEASISSKKLAIDPLLVIFAAGASSGKKSAKGALTTQINKTMAGISSKYRAKLAIEMENVSLQKFKVAKINANVSLNNRQINLNLNQIALYGGTLTGSAQINLAASGLAYNIRELKLSNFDATSFANTLVESFLTNFPDYKDLLNKVYGKLNLNCSISGQGVEPDAILANLSGQGSFSLTNGEIKRLKTLASVAETLKSNTLRGDIKFNTIQSAFSIRSKVITCKDFQLGAGDIKAGFNGSIDLAGQNWVLGNRLTLKLSPSASQGLPKEFNLFRDAAGWFALDFEITGPLKKPFPKPILDRPIEAVIGKFKVTIDAKKVEIEQKANEALRKFLSR